jgi:hypothetical protein
MKQVTQSLKLFAAEHVNAKSMRVAFVLFTLVTLVISAGAPVSSGGANGGR